MHHMHNYSYFHPIEFLVVYHLHQSFSFFRFVTSVLEMCNFFSLLIACSSFLSSALRLVPVGVIILCKSGTLPLAAVNEFETLIMELFNLEFKISFQFTICQGTSFTSASRGLGF